jgi:hypothetical protein
MASFTMEVISAKVMSTAWAWEDFTAPTTDDGATVRESPGAKRVATGSDGARRPFRTRLKAAVPGELCSAMVRMRTRVARAVKETARAGFDSRHFALAWTPRAVEARTPAAHVTKAEASGKAALWQG